MLNHRVLGLFLWCSKVRSLLRAPPNDNVTAPRRGGMRSRANTDPAGSGRATPSTARFRDGASSNQPGRSHGGRPGIPVPPITCKRFEIGTNASLGTPRSHSTLRQQCESSVGDQSAVSRNGDLVSPDKRRCVRDESEMEMRCAGAASGQPSGMLSPGYTLAPFPLTPTSPFVGRGETDTQYLHETIHRQQIELAQWESKVELLQGKVDE